MRRVLTTVALGWWVAAVGVPLVVGAFQSASSLEFASPEAEQLVDERFFDDVRARLTEATRLEDAYFFRERRTEINTNPFGRLGTGDIELYEVYPSETPGLTYRRLVAENGVPLSDAELAEQDREYHARAAEVRRRQAEEATELARMTPEELAARERERAERAERAREQTEDILASLRFTVEGREMFEGRPAVVLAFGPAPDANPETRRGDLARKFGGRVWIDEAAREVRYAEAPSVDSISFGLGLAARISDGAAATLRRDPIDEGVWMPTSVTLVGSGRAVLFLRGLTIDYSVEWFDYTAIAAVTLPGAPDATTP